MIRGDEQMDRIPSRSAECRGRTIAVTVAKEGIIVNTLPLLIRYQLNCILLFSMVICSRERREDIR